MFQNSKVAAMRHCSLVTGSFLKLVAERAERGQAAYMRVVCAVTDPQQQAGVLCAAGL